MLFLSQFFYCLKYDNVNHNEYITFSTSKFAYSLDEGDTIFCEAEIGGHQDNYDDDNNKYQNTILKKMKGCS